MNRRLKRSTRKDKRYMLTSPGGRTLHFGARGGSTYIDHGDPKKKSAWVARHRRDKGWDDPESGIYYSRILLWGDSKSLATNASKIGVTIS